MAAKCTHGRVVSAAGATTTAETLIGLIELPASADKWKLHHIMGQIAAATADAAEFIGGFINMSTPSGDVEPNPLPSNWPVYAHGSHLGALVGPMTCPLQRYPLDLDASGKANIRLASNLAIACTTAPRWLGGIAFGPSIPEVRPFKHCDFVRTTLSAAARAAVGTIALPEGVSKITGIMGVLAQDGVLTAAEELVGFFDLESEDVDLLPSEWMFNEVHSAGVGATMANAGPSVPQYHVVDIPVIGGADIDVFATLDVAVTNPANVSIFLMFE